MKSISTIIEKLKDKGYEFYYIHMFLSKHGLTEIYIKNPYLQTIFTKEPIIDVGFESFKERQRENIELALIAINYLNYV